MAIKPLNSVGGFSVGLPANTVIDSNGNITAAKATLVGNLSAGAGNLSFNSTTQILTVLGNIVSTNANLGNAVTANFFTGVLTTNAQTNITSVGTLTSLTVDGVTSLGPIANVNITGGQPNYVISTDGAGTLSFVSPAAAAGLAGSDTQVQFNNNGSFGASANFTFNNGTNTLAADFFTGTLTTNAQPNITSVGILSNVSVSGTATVGNVSTLGNVSAGGNVTGAYIIGNGSQLTSITGASVTGQVGNALISGTVYTNAQPNITSVGTLTSLDVTGNVAAGNLSAVSNISAGGNVTASYFIGNGSALSNITGGNVFGQVANANIADQVYNNAQPNITSVGNLTSLSVVGTATVGNLSTVGTASVGGLATVGNLSTTGAVSAGTLTVSGVSSLGNVGNVKITGGTTGQYLQTDGNGNLSFATIGTSGIANGTSNVNIPTSGGNVNTSVGGNANVFVVTSTGANVDGTLGVSGNANVGNLGTAGVFATTLSATGDATVGNVSTGNVSASGNITVGSGSGGTISGANLVSANYFTGTLTTAAQPNITSVGNLTSLSVVGNANVGNLGTAGVFATTLSATGNANVGNIGAGVGSFSAGVTAANLTSNNLTNTRVTFTSGGVLADDASFNFATGNGLVTATAFSGNGTLLTNVAANTAVTVTANAQPNITSVGNLTTLSVVGTATVGNLSTVGNVSATGNGTFGNVSTGGALSVTGTATVGNVSTGGSVSATGTVQGGNLSTSGAVTSATLDVTGTANVGNLSTTGVISATGNITTNAGLVSNTLTAFANTSVTISAGAGSANANVILAPAGDGVIAASAARIVNVATPTADADAATKAYVDSLVQGLNIKAAVQAASTTNLVANYVAGGGAQPGVGATLTSNTNGALVLDGQTISAVGTRVLIKDQSTGAQNGIYTLTTAGTVSAPWVLTRALDMNSGSEADAAFTFVEDGTVYANTGWTQTNNPVVIGTDPMVWTQFSGAGQYTANTSAGLILNGTVFSAKVDGNANPTIAFDGQGNLYVPANAAFTTPQLGAATATSISVSGNVTAANLVGPLANGNTSITMATNGNITLSPNGTATLTVAPNGANIAGNLSVSGNITAANISGNISGNLSGNITIPGANTQVVYVDANGFANSSAAFTFNNASNVVTVSSVLAVTANTKITGSTITTSSVTTLPIATFPISGVTGVEYIVKGVSAGGAYSMATVQAITDGSNVDYAIFGTLALGGATFSDLVVVKAGGNIELQVTPASTSSTVWTTQYRLI